MHVDEAAVEGVGECDGVQNSGVSIVRARAGCLYVERTQAESYEPTEGTVAASPT